MVYKKMKGIVQGMIDAGYGLKDYRDELCYVNPEGIVGLTAADAGHYKREGNVYLLSLKEMLYAAEEVMESEIDVVDRYDERGYCLEIVVDERGRMRSVKEVTCKLLEMLSEVKEDSRVVYAKYSKGVLEIEYEGGLKERKCYKEAEEIKRYEGVLEDVQGIIRGSSGVIKDIRGLTLEERKERELQSLLLPVLVDGVYEITNIGGRVVYEIERWVELPYGGILFLLSDIVGGVSGVKLVKWEKSGKVEIKGIELIERVEGLVADSAVDYVEVWESKLKVSGVCYGKYYCVRSRGNGVEELECYSVDMYEYYKQLLAIDTELGKYLGVKKGKRV